MEKNDYSYEAIVTLINDYMVAYRKKEHMTQQQLAEKSGIKQPMIARIESGKTDPQLSTFKKLLDSLGLEIQVIPKLDKEVERDIEFAFGINELDGVKPSPKIKNIIRLLAAGLIDEETAEFAISRI